MLFAFLIPALTAVSSWAALGMPTDRTAIGLLVSTVIGSLVAAIIAFSKEFSGNSTSNPSSTPTSPAKTQLLITSFPSKLKFFLTAFAINTSGRLGSRGRTQYDPDPRRRKRHRGHRKGVEPAGLKRYRLSHLSGGRHRHITADPRRRRHLRRRHYDPAPPRRYSRIRSYASRAGRGAEGILNKWGTAIGFALGIGAGVYGGYTQYHDPAAGYGKNADANYLNTIIGGDIKNDAGTVLSTRIPEVAHLWATNDPGGYNTIPYLQYKFTGQKPDGTKTGSAWVIPFWASFGTWIATTVGMKIGRLGKLHRIMRPLNKIAKGSTIATLIGALVLPGCGKHDLQGPIPPPPPNTLSMKEVSPGHFAQAQEPPKQFTYLG